MPAVVDLAQLASHDASAAGWFGKLPALGDFATRRLPQPFTQAWDAWLSRELAGSRLALGDHWLDAYLHGPIWRFALMPGVFDEAHWIGVMMPSVDRVGRYYPLTVVARFGLAPGQPLAAIERWLEHLATSALGCLDAGATVASFEADLTAAGMPQTQPIEGCVVPEGPADSTWLPTEDRLSGALLHLAAPLMRNALRGTVLWWPWRCQGEPQPVTISRGLPVSGRFVKLLQGAP